MAKKTLEYYMNLPYRVEIHPEDDGSGYTAMIPDLPGCMTCGDTIDEVWEMIEEAKELWLEVAIEEGDYIPEPKPMEIKEHSGKFIVRLPRSLHRQLTERAEIENTSLNQLVVALLSESMGRWFERSKHEIVAHRQPMRVSKPIEAEAYQKFVTNMFAQLTHVMVRQRPKPKSSNQDWSILFETHTAHKQSTIVLEKSHAYEEATSI